MKTNVIPLSALLTALIASTRLEAEPPKTLPLRPVSPGHTPAAIASTQKPLPTFRVQPKDSPSVAEIDDAVAAIMKLNGVRGAALAIVDGTRLVYAKGYTWALPDYPDVQPTTFFRQASVSKTFAAIAIYQLIQEGEKDGKLTFDTTLQSVLHLKTPDGKEPTDPNFNKITIRHLLDMTAGVDAGLVVRDIQATQAFKAPLPATPAQLASYGASEKLSGTPGDKSIATYSNGGFFLLSQVVTRLRGARSYEAALTSSLLKPLGIKRVREAHSLVETQPPDEARYHPISLIIPPPPKGPNIPEPVEPKVPTEKSVMSPDRPTVTLGYGGVNLENGDGAGGLSAAVTDVARVLAALSLRENNPMLSDATITTMLSNAAADSADPKLVQDNKGKGKAWGFHGFDAVAPVNAAKGTYWGYKGGDLSTSQNGIYFERGGISYVICWNGLVRHSELPFYPIFKGVLQAAKAHDWGNTDLFPKYGMPSFTPKIASVRGPGDLKISPPPSLKQILPARPH